MNQVIAVVDFLSSQDTPSEGDFFATTPTSSIMNLEISGTSTNFQVVFEGMVDSEWRPRSAVNLATMEFGTTASDFVGTWELSLVGLNFVRVRLDSIANGNVSVVGRVVG